MSRLSWVILPSVDLTAFKPILIAGIIFSHFLFNLAANIQIILEHIYIDSLAFEKIHLEDRQVIIEIISLNDLATVVLEYFFGFWRFEPAD